MENTKKYTPKEAFEMLKPYFEENKKWLYDSERFNEYLWLTLNSIDVVDEETISILKKYQLLAFLEFGKMFLGVCEELGIQNKQSAKEFLYIRRTSVGCSADEVTKALKKYKELGGE